MEDAMYQTVIRGVGTGLPKKAITNKELESIVTDYDPVKAGRPLEQWVEQKYGILTRHWATDETTADLATEAARNALNDAGLTPAEIDLILVSTVTNDNVVPGTSKVVQARLDCAADTRDYHEGCPGFVKALIDAGPIMDRRGYRYGLVIGAERMSSIIHHERFKQAALFGDAAGAVVVEQSKNQSYGIIAAVSGSDGRRGEALLVTGKGQDPSLISNDKEVYSFAVAAFCKTVLDLCRETGSNLQNIDLIVPHQASVNIIKDAVQMLNIEPSKVITYLKTVGNTSSASVPLALEYAIDEGKLNDRDRVMLIGMGAGLAWAGAYLIWRDYHGNNN